MTHFSSPINLAISQVPVTKDKANLADITALYDSVRTLQQAVTTYSGLAPPPDEFLGSVTPADTILIQNMNKLYVQASENLAIGAVVNLHNVAGNLRVRNANATDNTKQAHGFIFTAVTSGNIAEVILFTGLQTYISGLTVATKYYLSTVNGLITTTAPVATGNIEQLIGIALAPTMLYFKTELSFIQH